MSTREEVAPGAVAVELDEAGVAVEYADGRETFYHGVPEAVEGPIRCQPGKEVHLLATRPSGGGGVLVYVNDRATEAEILEDSGVGRVLLEPGEVAEVLPGVTVEMDGYAVEVRADPSAVEGRLFVFEEDEFEERSYELVES